MAPKMEGVSILDNYFEFAMICLGILFIISVIIACIITCAVKFRTVKSAIKAEGSSSNNNPQPSTSRYQPMPQQEVTHIHNLKFDNLPVVCSAFLTMPGITRTYDSDVNPSRYNMKK